MSFWRSVAWKWPGSATIRRMECHLSCVCHGPQGLASGLAATVTSSGRQAIINHAFPKPDPGVMVLLLPAAGGPAQAIPVAAAPLQLPALTTLNNGFRAP